MDLLATDAQLTGMASVASGRPGPARGTSVRVHLPEPRAHQRRCDLCGQLRSLDALKPGWEGCEGLAVSSALAVAPALEIQSGDYLSQDQIDPGTYYGMLSATNKLSSSLPKASTFCTSYSACIRQCRRSAQQPSVTRIRRTSTQEWNRRECRLWGATSS